MQDLVFGSSEDLEPLRAVLDLGGCSGEDSELLLPSVGSRPLLDEPDLLRLGRARGAGTFGSGEESEPLWALGPTLGFSLTSGDEADLLRQGESLALPATSGEDPE